MCHYLDFSKGTDSKAAAVLLYRCNDVTSALTCYNTLPLLKSWEAIVKDPVFAKVFRKLIKFSIFEVIEDTLYATLEVKLRTTETMVCVFERKSIFT